ncbi:MAG: hypothetical protein SF339_08270, partial [Blastocatellia bacterium]|nr:hypothetical protein [Blastocatellia bacterium]
MLTDFVVGRAASSGGEPPMAFRYEKRASREDAKALRKVIFEFFFIFASFFLESVDRAARRMPESKTKARRRPAFSPFALSRLRVRQN